LKVAQISSFCLIATRASSLVSLAS